MSLPTLEFKAVPISSKAFNLWFLASSVIHFPPLFFLLTQFQPLGPSGWLSNLWAYFHHSASACAISSVWNTALPFHADLYSNDIFSKQLSLATASKIRPTCHSISSYPSGFHTHLMSPTVSKTSYIITPYDIHRKSQQKFHKQYLCLLWEMPFNTSYFIPFYFISSHSILIISLKIMLATSLQIDFTTNWMVIIYCVINTALPCFSFSS